MKARKITLFLSPEVSPLVIPHPHLNYTPIDDVVNDCRSGRIGVWTSAIVKLKVKQ
ncbi:MAG: hypothetical protein V3V43_00090 [Dehalococcoidales bacterium]